MRLVTTFEFLCIMATLPCIFFFILEIYTIYQKRKHWNHLSYFMHGFYNENFSIEDKCSFLKKDYKPHIMIYAYSCNWFINNKSKIKELWFKAPNAVMDELYNKTTDEVRKFSLMSDAMKVLNEFEANDIKKTTSK